MNDDPQSPRDLLLARHGSAEPQLDRVRCAALPSGSVLGWRSVLYELFYPQRAAWRALAAVWLALGVFHFTAGRAPATGAHEITVADINAWLNQSRSREIFAHTDFSR